MSLVAVAGLNAQVALDYQSAPKNSSFNTGKITHQQTGNVEKVLLWSNDISVAADWGFSNTSNPAQDWYIETDPANVPSDGPVSMTTAANGFLMIDSDTQGQSATQDAYATYQGATTINLTGQFNVTLEFEQHYRTYLDERYVDISADNGNNWTTYTVTDGSESGGTVISGIHSIDISSIAGNVSDLKLRFHYVGAWGWHWAVDDIRIKTTEAYDLSANGNAWGVMGAWGVNLPYYTTPAAQIQPINFCGINNNVGLNDVADATYTVNVPAGSFTGSGSINSVAGAIDTICATTQFTPAGVGTYVADASMSTSNPDTGPLNNDFADITFEVASEIYARDNVLVNGATDGGTYNQGFGFEVGNIFDMFADADITSVQVHIGENAVPGATVYSKLYSIDASTGDFVFIDQSDYYTLTAGDLDNAIDLPLLNGAYTLTNGEPYLVVVATDGDGGNSDDLIVGTGGDSEPQTTFYYDATDATWYYTTATPAVRMNFDATIGLNETSNLFEMEVYPNPANEVANVSFNLNNAADVNVNVTDLSGKVVYTLALGNLNAGLNEVTLNTAAFANGFYTVNVNADNAISSKKLAVRK